MAKPTPTCTIDGCENPQSARQMCNKHYLRWWSGKPIERTTYPDTCTVEGCSAPSRTRGLCYAHYMKSYRYGTPTPEHNLRRLDLTGRVYGSLTVIKQDTNGGWICQCDCGKQLTVRTGDLNRGLTKSCGAREHHRTDTAGYAAAHGRVRNLHGSAKNKTCVDCGKQAAQWSYDHADPDERTQHYRGQTMPYSLNPDHYQPRCVPCHKAFDLARHHNKKTPDPQ